MPAPATRKPTALNVTQVQRYPTGPFCPALLHNTNMQLWHRSCGLQACWPCDATKHVPTHVAHRYLVLQQVWLVQQAGDQGAGQRRLVLLADARVERQPGPARRHHPRRHRHRRAALQGRGVAQQGSSADNAPLCKVEPSRVIAFAGQTNEETVFLKPPDGGTQLALALLPGQNL